MLYNFLYFIGVRTVRVLQHRSVQALDTFNQTVQELHDLNDKIMKEHSSKVDAINKLQGQARILLSQSDANSRVASKIEELLA